MRYFGLALAGLCLFVIPCSGQEPVSDVAIKAAIENLTSDPDVIFQVFYKNPERATELLIAALKPTARGDYVRGQHPQAVWIVRALRSLTGLDFRAATTADLSDEESHFLDRNARGQILFFGTWMSRDRTWVAPKDAQIAIIKHWQIWFAKHGHNYKYVNDRIADDWYF
jgi:hypothetical protein